MYTRMRVAVQEPLFDEDIYKETIREHLEFGHLQTLNLRSCRLKYPIWKDISSRKIQIDELKLDYTDLRKKIRGLPTCLVYARVKKLSLINTELDTQNLRAFYGELRKFERKKIKLQSLNLMHVGIDSGGWKVLARILNLLPDVVEELNVTNCGLTDEAIEALYLIISDGKIIRKLALGQNAQITPYGMTVVGELAEKCKVEMLDLSVCYLSNEHLDSASETSPQKISVLDLSKNIKLSLAEVGKLAKSWKSLDGIAALDCWFAQRDADKLVEEKRLHCKIITVDNTASSVCVFPRKNYRELSAVNKGSKAERYSPISRKQR